MRIAASRIILGLLNAALACGVVAQFMRGTQVEPLKHTPPRTLQTAHVELDAPAGRGLSAIQDRAVFYQARTFYVPPPVQTLQSVPNYKLVGTMIIPQQGSVATLMSNETSARAKVRQGDQLEGWTVTSISATRVTLELGGRAVEVDSKSSRPAILSDNVSAADGSGVPSQTSPVTVLGNASNSLRPLSTPTRQLGGTTTSQSQEPSLRHYYPPPSSR